MSGATGTRPSPPSIWPRPLLTALLALCVIASTGCAVRHTPLEFPTRPVASLDSSVHARFAYAQVGSVSLTEQERDEGVVVSAGEMRVHAIGAGDAKPHLVSFEYWRARGVQRGPAILVTPILGGGRRLARTNCGDLARAGYHVLLAWRGTHVLDTKWTLEDLEVHFRRTIGVRRALVDWLCTRSEVDPERLGAFGISMGGLVTAALLAVEPRLKAAVIALAGADVAGIVRVSDEGRLVRFREAKQKELGLSPAELEARMRRAFPSDPLNLIPAVDPRRVLLITTRYDPIVRPRFQTLLYEGLGRPQRYDLPTGHYTAILYLPFITKQLLIWLKSRQGPPRRLLATRATRRGRGW